MPIFGQGVNVSESAENQYELTYEDPDDKKNHGRLKFDIQRSSNGWELGLKIGTSGFDVDSLQGWTERSGRNRHTAFELEYLMKLKDAAFLELKDEENRVVRRSSLGNLVKSRWPQRRLKSDGTIDFMAFTKRLYLDETHMKLDGLGEGIYVADIVVRGEARLRAEITITKEGAKVSSMQLLGHVDEALSADFFMVNDAEVVAAVELLPAGDWVKLTLDQKWEIYDKMPADKRAGAVVWLAEQKDYAFIEQVAIYDPNGIMFYAAANTLFVERAPQWIRVAALATRRKAGHSMPQGVAYLTNPAVVGQVMAWDKLHSDKVLGSQFPILEGYFNQAKEKGAKIGEVGDALPPLKLKDLVADLKIDKQAEPNISKLKRAVDAVVTNQLWDQEGVIEAMEYYLVHGRKELQHHVALAYTYNLTFTELPVTKLKMIAMDESSGQALREAALLAYSSGDRLGVIMTLLEIVIDTKHPLWETAVSRMGDLDIGVMQQLVNEAELEPKQLELWKQELAIIDARVASMLANKSLYILLWRQVAVLAKKRNYPKVEALNQLVEKYTAVASLEPTDHRLNQIESLKNLKGGQLLTREEWNTVSEFLKTLEK